MAQGSTQERTAPQEPRGSQAGRFDLGSVPGGVEEALTTEQINQLLEEKPDWLIAERESYQNVLREERRVKALRAEKTREG